MRAENNSIIKLLLVALVSEVYFVWLGGAANDLYDLQASQLQTLERDAVGGTPNLECPRQILVC